MPIQVRAVKDSATAQANWSSGVQQGGNKWADGYAHPSRNPFDPSVINPDAWQAGVSDPNSKAKYARKLAAVNQDQVLATVAGPGKSKYTSAGTIKAPNYGAFSAKYQPFMRNLVASLPARGPRGTNRARINQLLDGLEAARGTFS